MPDATLDYATTRPRFPWLRLTIRLAAACAIGALVFAAVFLPVRTSSFWMDGVTGTTKHQSLWLGHFHTAQYLKPSPLEARLTRMGVSWRRDWRFMSTTEHSLLGFTGARGCGAGPPIKSAGHAVLQRVANTAADAEIRELVRVLQFGSDRQQSEAIEKAVDRSLERRP